MCGAGVVDVDAGAASGALSDSEVFETVLALPEHTTLHGQGISMPSKVFLNAQSAYASCSKDARRLSMFRE